MFCDQCGATLESGQQFCSRCGKQIQQGTVLARPGRVQAHVRWLGIFWLVLSAMNAVGGLIAVNVIGHWISGQYGPANGAPAFVRPLAMMAAIFSIVKAMFGFIAGWGLLNRQAWARPLAIVMGVISLFLDIPLGTALGAYTLWVLWPSHSQEEYERYRQAA